MARKKVQKLANGAKIVESHGEYQVYNSCGVYLGFTASADEAAFMAANGFPNVIPEGASDLSLWVCWNDAVVAGAKVLEDAETGTQFLSLGHGVIMSAKEDKYGYDTELLDENEFWERYRQEGFDVLALRVAEKPLTLE